MHVMHCHTLVDYAYLVRILSLEYEYDPVSGKANWKLDFLFLFPFSVFGDTAPYGPGRSNLKTRPFLFFAPKNLSRASITNMNLSEATGLRSAQTSLNALDNNPPCRTSFVHQVSRFCPFCVRRRGRRQPRCCQLGIGGVLKHTNCSLFSDLTNTADSSSSTDDRSSEGNCTCFYF